MGRAPCCTKVGLHRGPWTSREDSLLATHIKSHGEGNWKFLPKRAGLLRCGKSCRLRWMNYLRPDIKRGNISPEEDDLIIRLHSLLGNRWSLIAGRLPCRTDNEIKNYWNSHLSKKCKKQSFSVRESSSSKRLNSLHKISNRNKNNTKEKSINEEDAVLKIYAPKATRIAPRLMDCIMRAVTESSGEHAAAASHERTESGDENSSRNYQEEPANLLDVNHYLDLDFDLANCGFFLQDHAVLDRVYREYSQLLNAETDKEHLIMDPF